MVMKLCSNLKWPFIIAMLILISACRKDWFNVKSDKNVTVLATLQDFEMLLDNYDLMSWSPAIGEIASDGHFVPESIWTLLNNSFPIDVLQKNAYTWSKFNLNTKVQDWDKLYNVVFNCNLVLEGVRVIERSNSNMKQFDRVKGNALFHRARAYYELSQIFTAPYDPSQDSRFGLPFKNETDVAERLTRSSVYETFNLIIVDLKQAVELLPERASPVTRGSKAACWSLLARISLIMNNFDEALTYSDKALKIHSVLMDYSKLTPNYSNLGQFNTEVIFHTEMINLPMSYHPRFCLIDTSLYSKYDTNDLRKSLFFKTSTVGVNFIGMYNNRFIQFGGIATDEIYLIKAEACARNNRISESMRILNSFLKMRYKVNEDGTSTLIDRKATNELNALSIIFEEREKELLLRGIRWTDLRRWSKDMRFAKSLERKINGNIYLLQPNSMRFAFPIPDDEVSYSGIEQNPGWD